MQDNLDHQIFENKNDSYEEVITNENYALYISEAIDNNVVKKNKNIIEKNIKRKTKILNDVLLKNTDCFEEYKKSNDKKIEITSPSKYRDSNSEKKKSKFKSIFVINKNQNDLKTDVKKNEESDNDSTFKKTELTNYKN